MRESSANFEVVVMQEFQSIQNRYEGRMEENERRVTQVIGSAARDALRGQRNHMLHEVPVLLEAGQGEEEFVKSQMHRRCSHTLLVTEDLYMDEKVNKERINYTKFQIEELMMTSLKDASNKTLESARQAVVSAQRDFSDDSL